MKLLHIDSSIQGPRSVSRELTLNTVEHYQKLYPGIEVIYRDLDTEGPSHLSGDMMAAAMIDPAERTAVQSKELARNEALLQEFLSADIVVIGAPMYNFSISSQLKAWVDRVMVNGRTFKYTANGPVGLVGNTKVIIVSSRGGIYSQGSPAQAMDHQEAYLKVVFGFIGIKDVSVIRAEGVNMADKREQAIADAHSQVHQMLTAAA